MKHTPGPWGIYVGADSGEPIAVNEEKTQRNVADLRLSTLFTEKEANARLIAAAPDLFEACKEFVRKVECGEARSIRSYAQMKVAIAKAEGGAA